MNISIKSPNLRALTRKALTNTAQCLKTLDTKLEPKEQTYGQQLDEMLNDPKLDTKAALEAMRTVISDAIKQC